MLDVVTRADAAAMRDTLRRHVAPEISRDTYATLAADTLLRIVSPLPSPLPPLDADVAALTCRRHARYARRALVFALLCLTLRCAQAPSPYAFIADVTPLCCRRQLFVYVATLLIFRHHVCLRSATRLRCFPRHMIAAHAPRHVISRMPPRLIFFAAPFDIDLIRHAKILRARYASRNIEITTIIEDIRCRAFAAARRLISFI